MANEQNLIPNSERTPEQLREQTRKGGIASGKARRERKTIADALRKVLDEQANESGLTRQEAIVAKVVKRLYDEGDIRDLKTLTDVLGESVQNINLNGVSPIVAESPEQAQAISAAIGERMSRKKR